MKTEKKRSKRYTVSPIARGKKESKKEEENHDTLERYTWDDQGVTCTLCYQSWDGNAQHECPFEEY